MEEQKIGSDHENNYYLLRMKNEHNPKENITKVFYIINIIIWDFVCHINSN